MTLDDDWGGGYGGGRYESRLTCVVTVMNSATNTVRRVLGPESQGKNSVTSETTEVERM